MKPWMQNGIAEAELSEMDETEAERIYRTGS